MHHWHVKIKRCYFFTFLTLKMNSPENLHSFKTFFLGCANLKVVPTLICFIVHAVEYVRIWSFRVIFPVQIFLTCTSKINIKKSM